MPYCEVNVCTFVCCLTVIILCLPLLGSTLTNNLLSAINSLRLAQLPNTTLIAVHLTSVTPFLPVPQSSSEPPSIPESTTTVPVTHTENLESDIYLQNRRSNTRHSPKHTSTQTPKVSQTPAETLTSSELLLTSEYTDISPRTHTTSKGTQTPRLSSSILGNGSTNSLGPSRDASSRWKKYSPPEEMSQATKRAMLVLTVTESGVSVEEMFNQSPASSNFTRHTEVSVTILPTIILIMLFPCICRTDRTSWSRGQNSCFLFRISGFHILALRAAILTEAVHSSPQPLESNAEIVNSFQFMHH